MRIFQILGATTNEAVPGNRVWRRYLHETLVEMGHDVVLFAAEDGARARADRDARLRAEFSQRLLDEFERERRAAGFDVVFAYLMEGMVEPAAIDALRAGGAPVCNFSCNNVHQFDLVADLAPHFDLNLHSERDVGDKFRGVGATPLWWPMAANPRYAHPYDVPRTVEASFVGLNYGVRSRHIAALLEAGVDVHAYGPRWTLVGAKRRTKRRARRAVAELKGFIHPASDTRTRARADARDVKLGLRVATAWPDNVHDPVDDDEVIRLYSRSHVSLGFLEVYERHDPAAPILKHLHLRDFEAPMSGAVYLVDFCDELAEMFEPDREVVVWREPQELVEKARYYGEHPEAGEAIRAAGRARALGSHTYQRRFEDLFAALDLG